MGYLLREALKTLCVSNQWSYAVFWKIGFQNPKLLIWEECYYEPLPCPFPPRIAGIGIPNLPVEGWKGCLSDSSSSEIVMQEADRVCSLVNKMMVNNQVNLVGEGIVGRAAFIGNHQWFLLNNFTRDAYPPEVHNEVHLQFSAGMQTVAVIPVLPYGVVQLGSSMAITENLGFVNDLKSLILQLGCVPGAIFSENYVTNISAEKLGGPVNVGVPASVTLSGSSEVMNSTPLGVDGSNEQNNSSCTSKPIYQPDQSHIKEINNHLTSVLMFQTPYCTQILPKYLENLFHPKADPAMTPSYPGELENGGVGAEVIPSNFDAWMDQHSDISNSRSRAYNLSGLSQSCSSYNTKLVEKRNLSVTGVQDYVLSDSVSTASMGGNQVHGGWPNPNPCTVSTLPKVSSVSPSGINQAGTRSQKHILAKAEGLSLRNKNAQSGGMNILPEVPNQMNLPMDFKGCHSELVQTNQKLDDDLYQAFNIPWLHSCKQFSMNEYIPGFADHISSNDQKSQIFSSMNAKQEIYDQPLTGDDLFDVLGVEFKNKLLGSNSNKLLTDEPNTAENQAKNLTSKGMIDADLDCYSVNERISTCKISSGMGTDHLLDAVVSKAKSSLKPCCDDDVSCRTTLTRISTSSVPSISSDNKMSGFPNHVQEEVFGISKMGVKISAAETSSFRSGCSNDNAGTCSQSTSVYGSQLSSWVEQGSKLNRDSSVSTAYSKRPDEITKSNRKRLKPGENPRPRPKDRQMIQDRVKELREIVPNGSKCSIDALLERTIKHMLFLQSIAKHADKLKQTGESKIISKDGGLLLEDNFEGGATWAYEVGSLSMGCPIIVEDLNPPRQMLVEMLCEERGFFLEIADLIRGLGLTILKGLMETRNDKIWARFAVEANRDVTRVEIFMALVHLLEQTAKGGASSLNAIENLIAYQSFPQAAEIPATGMPNSLQ